MFIYIYMKWHPEANHKCYIWKRILHTYGIHQVSSRRMKRYMYIYHHHHHGWYGAVWKHAKAKERGAFTMQSSINLYVWYQCLCVCMSVFALTKMRGDVAKGCHRAKRSTHTHTHIEWVNELKMGDLVSECSSVWHAIAFHCLHHVLRLLLVSRLPITFHTHTHIYIGLRWVSLERRASGKKSIIAFLPFFLFCSQTASWDLEQWD